MVNFSVDQIRDMMDKPDNIRNISVIAHVDHGKSTLTDSLISKAGIIAAARSGDARFMDTRDDEQARAITIKSTAVSLFYEKENDVESVIRVELKKNGKNAEEIVKAFKALDKMPDAERAEFLKKYEAILADTPITPYLINLIDSPGHVDFSSEVTAALRVTDGALVVVDCVSGVSVQTETVLRQALAERIKPVLFLNKIDRQLLEHLIKEPEEAYQAYRNSVESANAVIATYRDETLGDVQVDPLNGTVGFGSGYHAWGFTLQRFANMYERMGKGKAKSLLKRMWGDQFQEYTVRIKQFHNGKPVFSSAEKVVGPELQKLFKKNKKHKPSWVKKDNMPKPVDGESDKELYRMSERGFCFLVYRPISDLAEAIITEDKDKYEPELKKWGIKLPPDAIDKSGKDLVKSAMRVWLPAGDTLLDMICTHLPSPREAQRYRLDNLYTGPLDDACANGIRNCDPKAPLMLYVSKMVPTSDKGRFFAFGRVFSGTVKTGQAARILTEDYVPGKTVVKPKKIQRTVLMMGRYTEQVADMPCGNVVGLVGVDQYILKTATLTTDDEGFPIKTMKFSVSPVVRVAVETTNASDLPKLVEGLKRLSKSDPLVQISTAKTGEHIIAGAGELHIQICIQDLRDDYLRGAGLRVSEPVVSYAESLQQTRSDYEDPTNPGKESCMGKSPNKHNRIRVWAEELGDKLTVAIDDKDIHEQQDVKERARALKNDFDWHPDEARKIWTFGCLPDARCNLLVDMTKSVQYLHEIKDSCVGAFMQATAGGPLCDEVMRGCRFNIDDVTLHADSIHRGAGQIMPPMKRAVFAAMLKFQPAIMEPIYLVEITSNMDMESKIYNLMSQNRGSVDSKDEKAAAPMIRMKCYLPVMESFGFNAKLLTACSGEAFSQLTFSHWQLMNGNPLEEGSSSNKVMMAVRERKGLKTTIPKYEDYNDRL